MDRTPIASLVGSLAAWEGVDQRPVLADATERVISQIHVQVTDVAALDVVVQFGNEAAGAGDTVQVTIPAGQRTAEAAVSLSLSGTQDLYQQVITGSTALNLSGWVALAVAGAAPAGTYLTTIWRVKRELGITGTDKDDLLSVIIAGVSDRIETYCDRVLREAAYQQKYSTTGNQPDLRLLQYPVESGPTVVESGVTLVEGTDFELELETGTLWRMLGELNRSWPRGIRNVEVSYTAGYATIPDDVVDAATKQVTHDYKQTDASGAGMRGLENKALADGGQASYQKDAMLPEVMHALAGYRRFA